MQEIEEQPAVLERIIENESQKIMRIGDFLRARDVSVIILVARGSSDNAAVYGRYLLEVTTGIPVSLAAPSIFTLYNAKMRLNRAVVIGVSQSGEGEDINLVLDSAKGGGAFTIGITNEDRSSMVGLVDEPILIQAGKERSVAATKTYTGQMMSFLMLANALGDKRLAFNSIPAAVKKALELKVSLEEVAQRYVFMENCVVVGRGMNYGNSFELALKLMETCYVVAERFSSADFLHGPLAVVERRFPVIIFAPSGVTRDGNLELIAKLKGLQADCLVITDDDEVAAAADLSLRLPETLDEFLAPVPLIVPGQIFAALLSEAKRLNPDEPRSLSKVTKTV